MPSLSAFLFDLDGTLVCTPIDFAGMKRSVLDIAGSFGLDPEPLRPFDILGIIEQAEAALDRQAQEKGDSSLSAALRDQAEAALTRCEIEATSVAEELPGAVATLMELREQQYLVAIVTRNCRTAVQMALERVPLPHDLLLTRNDVPSVKPDPRHLLAAARHFHLPPDRCAMAGDHPMDVQGGHAAGMFTIAFLSRDPSPEAFREANPHLILTGIGDLLPWMSASSSSTGTPASC